MNDLQFAVAVALFSFALGVGLLGLLLVAANVTPT